MTNKKDLPPPLTSDSVEGLNLYEDQMLKDIEGKRVRLRSSTGDIIEPAKFISAENDIAVFNTTQGIIRIRTHCIESIGFMQNPPK